MEPSLHRKPPWASWGHSASGLQWTLVLRWRGMDKGVAVGSNPFTWQVDRQQNLQTRPPSLFSSSQWRNQPCGACAVKSAAPEVGHTRWCIETRALPAPRPRGTWLLRLKAEEGGRDSRGAICRAHHQDRRTPKWFHALTEGTAAMTKGKKEPCLRYTEEPDLSRSGYVCLCKLPAPWHDACNRYT